MRLFWLLICGVVPILFCGAQEKAPAGVANRNQQYVDDLAKAGVVPVQTVIVDAATFRLSKPFALDESHQIAVAWVSVAAQQAIRVLYRSNSQCSWRMCDAMTDSHIGKGFHEFDKQLPLDVNVALLRACSDVGELMPWFPAGEETSSQYALAGRLLSLLTADRDQGLQFGDVLRFGSPYVTREYASLMPVVARRFFHVNSRMETASGQRVANPRDTELPVPDLLPDLKKLVDTVDFDIPSYYRYAQTEGPLTGRVYRSKDQTLQYFFVEDSQERAMLACVEIVHAPVCILGLRTQYLDVQGMDTPLMEYGSQIPIEFGGRRKGRYQLNWNWVRQLPIIQFYYRSTGREIPPEA